jgi:hypothetical protein
MREAATTALEMAAGHTFARRLLPFRRAGGDFLAIGRGVDNRKRIA